MRNQTSERLALTLVFRSGLDMTVPKRRLLRALLSDYRENTEEGFSFPLYGEECVGVVYRNPEGIKSRGFCILGEL